MRKWQVVLIVNDDAVNEVALAIVVPALVGETSAQLAAVQLWISKPEAPLMRTAPSTPVACWCADSWWEWPCSAPSPLPVRVVEVAGAGPPAAWVTGDTVYGHSRALWSWLKVQGLHHVLAVPRPLARGRGAGGP